MTAPVLCPHHAAVLDEMRSHRHVTKAAAKEAAREMHRQCCRKLNQEETR